MWYILSFAFQLSGGVILLLWAFRKTQEQIVYSYYPIEAVPKPNNDDMCTMKKERVQEIATDIYRNRFAFGDLCAGYLIAVVAGKILSDCVNFISVLIIASAITGIECYFAKMLAKRKFSEDMQVPASKLKELGVHMTASDREFDEMLSDIGLEVK